MSVVALVSLTNPAETNLKHFEFDIFINEKLLSRTLSKFSEIILKDRSVLLNIWNQVDNKVRSLIKNGLYKDTASETAIINNTFEGYDRL